MTKKNVPEIRFKRYASPWIKGSLDKEAQFNPKDDLPDVFEYVDLESVSGTELLSHRTEIKGKAPSRAQRLAKKGDLFYQTVRPYQKNNYLFELPESDFVFSTGYAQLRPKNDGYFLLSLVQNELFVKDVLNSCTGSSYPAINSTDLAKIEIKTPEKPEEYRDVGNVFRHLDRLITLHSKKYEKLLNVKKAMLEKMFPKDGADVPEIRFKGFTDSWSKKALSEIADVYDGTHQTPKYTDSGVMFLSVENIKTLESKKYISRDAFRNDFKVCPQKGDILMTRIGDIGTANVIESTGPIAYYVSLALLKPKGIDSTFLKECIHTSAVKKELWHRTLHIAFPKKINKNEIEKILVSYPKSKDEQKKIGNYLKKLNDLICYQGNELEKLKNIKKAMLEKMFV